MKHGVDCRVQRDPPLAMSPHTLVPCPCLIGPRVDTPDLIWANRILPPRKMQTWAHRDQAAGAHGIHCPGEKIQEDLLVRTLGLPWLCRFPFDSVNNHSGLHLGLPGVNSVVCLRRHLIGKSSLTHHPSPVPVHAHDYNHHFLFAQLFP